MSVEIVGGSFRRRIEGLLGAPRQRVWLAAPFVSNCIAGRLIALPAAEQGDRRLLVSWSAQGIESGYLSARGVQLLSSAGFAVRDLQALHAKAIVVDRGAYVGSGNLTSHGLYGKNVEIGAFASGAHATSVQHLFQRWWRAAVEISPEQIQDAVELQIKLRKEGRIDRREPQPGYQPPPTITPPRHWIKSQYYRPEGWEIAPGTVRWISDPGVRDKHGRHKRRRDGTPAGEPSYRIDDTIGIYYATTLKVPSLVRVVETPVFAPDFVQEHAEGGEPDAGVRWPWVTWVEGIAKVPLDSAPDIDHLGIRGPILWGTSHFTISDEQHERLLRALTANSSHTGGTKADAVY